jgi:hypothetical protein
LGILIDCHIIVYVHIYDTDNKLLLLIQRTLILFLLYLFVIFMN